jgi:hypothetical protein
VVDQRTFDQLVTGSKDKDLKLKPGYSPKSKNRQKIWQCAAGVVLTRSGRSMARSKRG